MQFNEKFVRNIDGVWPLEGFITQKHAEPSIKFGFIGLGQAGGKMVDAFAAIRSPKNGEPIYQCMVINSNLGDMRSLRNIPEHRQFGLKGYENGVGKNPNVGRQAFEENGEYIFDAITEIMAECPIIVLVSSLGGGTGSGAINILSDAIADYLGKPVMAITALPRPDEIESLNAFNALAELVPKLNEIRQGDNGAKYRALENVIILDNEKIWNEHSQDPEVSNLTWDFYSNYKVASIFHEWNVLTSLESDITLDAADLQNHVLLTGSSISFAKKRINLDEIKSQDDLITQIIQTYRGKNVLANGFDYKNDMRSMALVAVMPRDRKETINQDTLELLRTKMKQDLPNISFYPGFATSNSQRYAVIYTIAAINGLPERARNLRQEAEELARIREERERQASGFNVGQKIAQNQVAAAAAPRRNVGLNPFAKNTDTSRPIKNNPFRK